MPKRRKYSPEFKQGAVEQTRQPGVSCAQIARELGIDTNMLARWRREANSEGRRSFGGTGTPRDEEMARLKRELSRVKKERDFLREAQRTLPRSRLEISGDSTLSQSIPDSPDVSLPEDFDQRLLRLEQAHAEHPADRQRTVSSTHSRDSSG